MSDVIDTGDRNKEELEAMEVAEDSREKDWTEPSFVADLFMGKFQMNAVLPFPLQDPEDKKEGEEFCQKLDKFLSENLDESDVDEKEEIPEHVLKGLAEMGCFGLKIPKEYGGKGFSQSNYLRALAIVARHCGSTAATLSAHQSIGVPQPLRLFGTDEQKKKYLPRFSKGELSAFALTEPGVGSDPAQMETFAEPTPDGNHYIINGHKLWCTNGAKADVIVVMARTPSIMKNGREKKQITAFIVEKGMAGLSVEHRCRFMGLRGIQNALLKFENVKVPKENIIWGLGKGLRLALITLNAGRLSLPATCVGGARDLLEVCRSWGNQRVQWGSPVGKHAAGAAKIASLSANAFAMDSITQLASSWVDSKKRDIRLEAAMAKVFCSEEAHRQLDQIIQFKGGRGYERSVSLRERKDPHPEPLERMYRDSRINRIVEGTTEILSLFIAREALDRHLSLAGDAINPKVPMGKRIKTFIKAGLFYSVWYPKQWITFTFWPACASLGKLGTHMRFVARNAKRLARTTFHLMVLNGPKLEKKQLHLIRLVEIATDLFSMSATIGHAHTLAKQDARYKDAIDVAEIFCLEARRRVRANFKAIWCNHDKKAVELSKKVLNNQLLWQEENNS